MVEVGRRSAAGFWVGGLGCSIQRSEFRCPEGGLLVVQTLGPTPCFGHLPPSTQWSSQVSLVQFRQINVTKFAPLNCVRQVFLMEGSYSTLWGLVWKAKL